MIHPQFDPIALQLGPLAIRWYGLMYLIAFVLFIVLGRLQLRRPHVAARGWVARDLEDLLFAGVLGVILGGRLGYILFYKPAFYLQQPLEILKIWEGGMSFHGGFLGVLVYSSSPKGAGEDGRIVWTLRSAGVNNVAIIDGGYEGWVAAGAKVSTAPSRAQPVSFTIAAVDASSDISKDEVKAALGRARIIDARSPAEYAGAQRMGEPRGGHLPGAISLPWDKMFDDKGRIRDANAVKKILTDAGVKPDDDIVAYCTIGLRSAHLTTVLKDIGYNKTRNYSASFYEWSNDASAPLVK